jgi:hypothetical protein
VYKRLVALLVVVMVWGELVGQRQQQQQKNISTAFLGLTWAMLWPTMQMKAPCCLRSWARFWNSLALLLVLLLRQRL